MTNSPERSTPAEQRFPDLGPRFIDFSPISHGERSFTFSARDAESGGQVFIKILDRNRIDDREMVEAFLNESAMLKLLSQDATRSVIVPVLAESQPEDIPYFVQPLLTGWDLAKTVRKEPRLHSLGVARVIEKCLEALVLMHGAGFAHGDLSPENIFLETEEPIPDNGILPAEFGLKLIDFESARRIEGSDNRGRTVLFKLGYASPELVKTRSLTVKSDLYAVGIMLYELLAGQRPFAPSSPEAIRSLDLSAIPPIPIALGVPQLLDEFIRSLIVPESTPRIETAAKALQELRKILEVYDRFSQPKPVVSSHILSKAVRGKATVTFKIARSATGNFAAFPPPPVPPRPPVLPPSPPPLDFDSFFKGPPAPRPRQKTVREADSLDGFFGRRRAVSMAEFELPDAGNKTSQLVNFSVYAPERIRPGTAFLLNVWAYLSDQRAEMLERAASHSQKVEVGSRGGILLPGQTRLLLKLQLDHFDLDNPIEPFEWCNEITNVSFLVGTPAALDPGTYPGQLQVLNGGLLISKLYFEVVVSSKQGDPAQSLFTEKLKHADRIRTAFASYSSQDRGKVIQRVQGISATGIDVFLDVASLRTGLDWEQQLNGAIELQDVFYLFWSQHAKASPFVEREWRIALAKRGLKFIHPIPLEDPQIAQPPDELGSLHFNDIYLAILNAAATGRDYRQ